MTTGTHNMAASAALLPLDQSRLRSSVDSEGVSSARQRRRRSTKKPGTQSLSLSEGNRGLELNPLRSSRDLPKSGGDHRDVAVTTTKIAHQNGTGRRSRSRRTEGARQSSPAIPVTSLEDSTDGVAAILQTKLDQLDLEEGKQDELEGRDQTLTTPCSDPGHSSGIVTESEEEGAHAAAEGRPLPPPANSDGRSGNLSATPSSDILAITVHGTDELQASVFLTHPSVRVSIVDVSGEGCGALLKKSAPGKCVISYYEKDNPSVDYILPVLTQPFECRHHRVLKGTLKAQWEETLIFNEHLSYFTSNENAVIFFELLDFVSFGGGRGYSRHSEQRPWHRIAWAFLRPSGKTCTSRIGRKIRLQLYKYPRKLFGHSTEGNEVYVLWQRRYRSTYPSTLYVTLRGVSAALPQEEEEEGGPRSLLPMQEEKGSITVEQMMALQLASKSYTGLGNGPSPLLSTSLRLPGQSCQIPTSQLSTQYPTPMGCSCLAFSHSGRLLVAGCADQDSLYPVVIFEVPSFKPVVVTEGHRGIVYQVCWSEGDRLLASASADGIVKIWSPEGGDLIPVFSMPHPCYVYCVCFLTGPNWSEGERSTLATGAYDSYIRIWSVDGGDASVQLLAEFHGHHGHVNCLLWLEKTSLLYAGDSKGVLGVWHRRKGAWMLKHKISVVNGQPLISLSLHPNHRKMLLQTQKATLVMLDLRISHVCCEYVGIEPTGLERCASVLTPCGGLVFAGTSQATVHVWSADTGKELYVYSDLPFSSAVGALAYHPAEHMLALSAFGSCQPLLALTHLIGSHPPSQTLQAGHGERSHHLSLPAFSFRMPANAVSGEVGGVGGGAGNGVGEAVSATSLLAKSQFSYKDSLRLKDLMSTLDGVTTKTKLS